MIAGGFPLWPDALRAKRDGEHLSRDIVANILI